jgi:outer membrane protein assembly factor BamB
MHGVLCIGRCSVSPLAIRRCVLHIPDPERAEEGNSEVEITDLDSPPEAGKVAGTPTRRHRISSFRVRAWMSIALIAAVTLLVVIILISTLHLPEVAKVTAPSLPTNYPVSLSVVAGVCYASSTTGVVTALRVNDGAVLWRHASGKAGEGSITIVDRVIYLAPLLPPDSSASTVTIEALRASNGSPLWSRSLPIDSPLSFQLVVVSGIVFIRSDVKRIEALRASDGSSLWHYTSQMAFVSMPSIADGEVYVGTQDGHLSALRASDGIPLWTYRSLRPLQTSPVVANGLIYLNMQKGGMDVLYANSGVLLWRYTSPILALGLYPQPLVVGGVVYVLTQDGQLSALHANNGFLIWRVALHANDILPLTIIEGGVILVETLDGSIEGIAESSGNILWQYHGNGRGLESLTAGQGVIYLAFPASSGFNTIGSVTVLQVSNGSVLWHYTPRVPAVQLVVENTLALIALQDGSINALSSSSGSLRWHRLM